MKSKSSEGKGIKEISLLKQALNIVCDNSIPALSNIRILAEKVLQNYKKQK